MKSESVIVLEFTHPAMQKKIDWDFLFGGGRFVCHKVEGRVPSSPRTWAIPSAIRTPRYGVQCLEWRLERSTPSPPPKLQWLVAGVSDKSIYLYNDIFDSDSSIYNDTGIA